MDTDTGHLIAVEEGKKPPKGYTPVPRKFKRAVRLKLRGRSEAHVSLTSGGKLSRWAAEDRAKKRRKAKRKAVEASKRRNRGKR